MSDVKVQRSQYGFWVSRNGRSRFVLCDEQELAQETLLSLERKRRAFKNGSHEPVQYYRDEQGRIGIPAEPGLLPEGIRQDQVFEATSLSELDGLSKEMSREYYEQWQDHGEFTEMMDEQLGSPRSALISQMMNPKTEKERDVIRLLLKELDQEAANRQRVTSDVYFHHREN